MLTNEERNEVRKIATMIAKEANGKGPKNICVKEENDQLLIQIEGLLSHFEKYLMEKFQGEFIAIMEDFYQRDLVNIQAAFDQLYQGPHTIVLRSLALDFEKDSFLYYADIK